MTSRYFDVGKRFDQEGNELYTNLTNSALSNKANDLNSEIEDYEPTELLDVNKTDKAKEIHTSLEIAFTEIKNEAEKLQENIESGDFDANDLDDSFDDLSKNIEKYISLLGDAENEDISFESSYSDSSDVSDILSDLNSDFDSTLDSIKESVDNLKEKIDNSEEFHKFIADTIKELNVSLDEENVIYSLIDGEEFSDIFENYVDNQYDFNEPIYNFVYPLYSNPTQEQLIKITKECNCVVIEDNDDNRYLALTGCGMDMSQDIVYAKGVILGEALSYEDCMDVCTEPNITQSGDNFTELMDCVSKNLERISNGAKRKIDEISQFTTAFKNAPQEESALSNLVKNFENGQKTQESVSDSDDDSERKTRKNR